MHIGFVVPIRDIDSFVTSDRVGIDRGGGRHAVLPLLLHFCMHNQQRVVGEVDRYLAFGTSVGRFLRVIVLGENTPDPELSSNAERY